MATAPKPGLPLFYNDLEPLSSNVHGAWKTRTLESAAFLSKVHAVPVMVEEFMQVQRHFPIVFSSGPDPVPLALMGLHEGVNLFVDDEGKPTEQVYFPAYVRRYPFMLARLRPDSEDLSLCFDPTAGAVGEFEEGEALFEGTEPTQTTKDILAFCEKFEQSGFQTGQFIKELKDHKLLIDGEVSIQPEGADKPFIYRGFQMISEEAVRELRGDVARKMIQSGMLPLIYAHLFSLSLIRDLFARQVAQGKMPGQTAAPAPANA